VRAVGCCHDLPHDARIADRAPTFDESERVSALAVGGRSSVAGQSLQAPRELAGALSLMLATPFRLCRIRRRVRYRLLPGIWQEPA
jgi:hypothetical protein